MCVKDDICSKTSFKYSLDRKVLETIYTSFIQQKLEYDSYVWDNCNDGESNLLESFQLEIAQIVMGAGKGTRHNLIYKKTGWETLSLIEKRQNELIFPTNCQ